MPNSEWSMGTERPVINGSEPRFKTKEPVRRQHRRLCEKCALSTISMQHRIWQRLPIVVRKLGSAVAGRQLQLRGSRARGRRSEEAILITSLMQPRTTQCINMPLISVVTFSVEAWVAKWPRHLPTRGHCIVPVLLSTYIWDVQQSSLT